MEFSCSFASEFATTAAASAAAGSGESESFALRRLKEICTELLGPVHFIPSRTVPNSPHWQSTVLGVSKRSLLRTVLPELRPIQKLATHISESLQHIEEATAAAAATNGGGGGGAGGAAMSDL